MNKHILLFSLAVILSACSASGVSTSSKATTSYTSEITSCHTLTSTSSEKPSSSSKESSSSSSSSSSESSSSSSSSSSESSSSSSSSSESSSSSSSSSSETSSSSSSSTTSESPIPHGYTKVCKGLYISDVPGLYDSKVNLKFYIEEPENYTLQYYLNTGKTENIKTYTNDRTISLDFQTNLGKEYYPLTTSVDGELLWDKGGKHTSSSYVNNIQHTGNYRLHPKQSVVTIRFKAKDDSFEFESAFTYIFETDPDYYTIPVVCLSMPYNDWFGTDDGFYNRIRDDISKRAFIEYFDFKTGEYFIRNTKVKLGGNYSLGWPQRTLNCNFTKDQYGDKNEPVDINIFKGCHKKGSSSGKDKIKGITRFRLHDGGNAFEDTGRHFIWFNDALIHKLMEYTDVATTSYRPCIGFMNGEYWGLYGIREHYSDTYFVDNYDIDKKDVCLAEYRGSLQYDDGDEEATLQALKEFNDFVNAVDFKNDYYYDQLCNKYMDIQSFADLLICQCYSGNFDFVGNNNNLKMWRTRKIDTSRKYYDGKWRFCLHDCDYAFTSDDILLRQGDHYSYNKMKLVDKLMHTNRFKALLKERIEVLMLEVFDPTLCIDEMDAFYDAIDAYRNDAYMFWGKTQNAYTRWLTYYDEYVSFFNRRALNFDIQMENVIATYN